MWALKQTLWATGWLQTYIVGYRAHIVGYRAHIVGYMVATDLHCGL